MNEFIAYRLFESSHNGGAPDGSFVSLTENDLSPGEVLIKVAYSSINYKDALAAAGINKIIRAFPRIGGIDLSGHVISSSDRRFKPGDAVVVHGFGIGVDFDGGHSQVARVAADSVMLLPSGIDVFEAAVIGTAGYTAALSLHWMEHNGLTPEGGPVLVSGATGGVAGVAIDILAGRGYQVTAMTGKESAEQYLRELGAHDVIFDREVVKNSKLIESARWIGAVDSAGGDTLAWILKSCMPDAVVASFGNAAGSSYEASVLPYILRGVRLIGINANSPMELRRVVWGKLAREYRPRHLASIANVIEFDQLPDFMARMRARANPWTYLDSAAVVTDHLVRESAGGLDYLFSPRSIAIVGASATPSKIGAVPLSLLKRFGYQGQLYPINPTASEIQGERCYGRLSDVGAPIDLAIFAVPVARAEQAFHDAVAAGVKSTVLFTSGFAETGGEGSEIQHRLRQLSEASGMRMLGPNCLGFMNVRANVYATFSPAPGAGIAAPGSISMVSQSGAFGAYAYSLARNRGLGLSYWITTGNQADVDVADCIEFLIEDAATRVIMLYMEGSNDGAKLRRALEHARQAQKPVVVTKVGRTSAGARAAMSHTAALAGDDAAYEALFRQCGALRAHSIEDFFNLGYALSLCPQRPLQKSLGVITISGGVGALIADDAEMLGVELPQLADDVQQQILELVPFAAPANPVDITGQATSEPILLTRVADLMMKQQSFGSLLVFLAAAGTSESLWPYFEQFAQHFTSCYPTTPLVLCSLFSPQHRAALERRGVLVYDDPSTAVRSMAAITQQPATGLSTQNTPQLPALAVSAGAVSEAEALAVLISAGIPVMPHAIAASKAQAIEAAERLGYPVVLKIASADILHKSDIGGVRLNIKTAEEVALAYDQVIDMAQRKVPDARIDGVLVAAMISGGIECIVGVKRDATMGALVMFGLGGIDVELYRDVSFRLAPFDRSEAMAMISEVRASAMLRGYRGRPAADVDALADVLVRLAACAAASDTLESVDINPLAVLSKGQGVVALDALVVGRQLA